MCTQLCFTVYHQSYLTAYHKSYLIIYHQSSLNIYHHSSVSLSTTSHVWLLTTSHIWLFTTSHQGIFTTTAAFHCLPPVMFDYLPPGIFDYERQSSLNIYHHSCVSLFTTIWLFTTCHLWLLTTTTWSLILLVYHRPPFAELRVRCAGQSSESQGANKANRTWTTHYNIVLHRWTEIIPNSELYSGICIYICKPVSCSVLYSVYLPRNKDDWILICEKYIILFPYLEHPDGGEKNNPFIVTDRNWNQTKWERGYV